MLFATYIEKGDAANYKMYCLIRKFCNPPTPKIFQQT